MTILEAVPAGIGQVAWLEENVVGRRLRVSGKWRPQGKKSIRSFVTVKPPDGKKPGVHANVIANFLDNKSVREVKDFDVMSVVGRVKIIIISEKTRRLEVTIENAVIELHARPDMQRLDE